MKQLHKYMFCALAMIWGYLSYNFFMNGQTLFHSFILPPALLTVFVAFIALLLLYGNAQVEVIDKFVNNKPLDFVETIWFINMFD